MTAGGNKSNEHFEDRHRLNLPALPPVIFGIPLIIGAVIHVFFWRSPVIGGAIGFVIGFLMMIAGTWLIYWTWKVMRDHGEHPDPIHRTNTLVTTGPFARTRNPIYSGFLLIGAGMSILLNSMAMLIFVFVGVAAIQVLVIRREEAYLEAKFGEVYLGYVTQVKRWI